MSADNHAHLSPQDSAPVLKKPTGVEDRFYRQGPDHRAGAEVGFVELRRRFDFRSIQMGQWMTPADLFYDALCDLMHILTGQENLVSLGGQPGLCLRHRRQTRRFGPLQPSDSHPCHGEEHRSRQHRP